MILRLPRTVAVHALTGMGGFMNDENEDDIVEQDERFDGLS